MKKSFRIAISFLILSYSLFTSCGSKKIKNSEFCDDAKSLNLESYQAILKELNLEKRPRFISEIVVDGEFLTKKELDIALETKKIVIYQLIKLQDSDVLHSKKNSIIIFSEDYVNKKCKK